MQYQDYGSDVAFLLELANELLKAALVLGKACSQEEVVAPDVLFALLNSANLHSVQAQSSLDRGLRATTQEAAHCQARHKCTGARHCNLQPDCVQVAAGHFARAGLS